MARLYLDERKLRTIGFDEAMIRTLRKLTEFVEAQEALEEAQADLADQGDAIDDANTDIAANNAAINAGQTVSVGYVQAEAQATDDAIKALATSYATLLTRLDTVNLLT
jgi:hypothetical protein